MKQSAVALCVRWLREPNSGPAAIFRDKFDPCIFKG